MIEERISQNLKKAAAALPDINDEGFEIAMREAVDCLAAGLAWPGTSIVEMFWLDQQRDAVRRLLDSRANLLDAHKERLLGGRWLC
jgi:hypothetical protein